MSTNSPADQLRAARALSVDKHIFRWFNHHYPNLMAECLMGYPDDDPAYAKIVENEGQSPLASTGGQDRG